MPGSTISESSNRGRYLHFGAEDIFVNRLVLEHCHPSQGEAFVLTIPELGRRAGQRVHSCGELQSERSGRGDGD